MSLLKTYNNKFQLYCNMLVDHVILTIYWPDLLFIYYNHKVKQQILVK